jgi:hypothetical protein
VATWSPSRSALLRIMNSSFSFRQLVVQCHVVLLDHAIDGPGVATRQERRRYRILVIRYTGRMRDGTGSRRRRMNESAAEPRFVRR